MFTFFLHKLKLNKPKQTVTRIFNMLRHVHVGQREKRAF